MLFLCFVLLSCCLKLYFFAYFHVLNITLVQGTSYARQRQVFGKPLIENQSIGFPLARGFVNFKAAELMVDKALEGNGHSRTVANMAKLLASGKIQFRFPFLFHVFERFV
jgi:hypothetical protein